MRANFALFILVEVLTSATAYCRELVRCPTSIEFGGRRPLTVGEFVVPYSLGDHPETSPSFFVPRDGIWDGDLAWARDHTPGGAFLRCRYLGSDRVIVFSVPAEAAFCDQDGYCRAAPGVISQRKLQCPASLLDEIERPFARAAILRDVDNYPQAPVPATGGQGDAAYWALTEPGGLTMVCHYRDTRKQLLFGVSAPTKLCHAQGYCE